MMRSLFTLPVGRHDSSRMTLIMRKKRENKNRFKKIINFMRQQTSCEQSGVEWEGMRQDMATSLRTRYVLREWREKAQKYFLIMMRVTFRLYFCSLLFLSILLFLVDWTLDLLPKYFVFLASFALGILSQFFIFLFRFKPQNSENFFAPFVLYISTKIRKMIFFVMNDVATN